MADEYVIREWWLVRHAPVDAGIIYGHLDLEANFSDTGRLDELAHLLPKESTVISSDLRRCRETARHILQRQKRPGFPLYESAALREQCFGQWEGKTYQEVEATDPRCYSAFFKNPAMCKPEGGESFLDIIPRVQGEIDRLQQSENGRHLLLITHAGVIRAIVGLSLGLSPEKMLSLAIDPLSVTHLTSFRRGAETSWRVNFVNDLSRGSIT
ncbi:histidine phosphatase family protein [Sneathiella sp. CAU 1612]|uniref:Histidine phosphatase family protein n=1 Tax=Sneathiella sedimenti TaxID=2816034 RepID=A0ABS3F1V7_9PROT|nr:histidine phosphatase family protein [Sneathiella sedimenti]MBO0332111.1 histidine phosphatase family protein [Sneathiella sedimenti]